MIIDSIRNYIRLCPYLSEFAKGVNVDYLGKEATAYSIEAVSCKPIIKEYIGGSSKRQYQFIFASREQYGAEVLQNMNNCGFYENFARWLEVETLKGNLPILDSGKKSLKIEATSTGYAFQTDIDKARYQIQANLTYLQGGN
ncbi:MAG: chloramphenicol resistance protein [Clostridium sp.]|uniref:chloramphenicol resistance protein n=1 Tax=Clostridium sp. TaxID=1506 RepID=UPI00305E2535